jgi:hypothetical protein
MPQWSFVQGWKFHQLPPRDEDCLEGHLRAWRSLGTLWVWDRWWEVLSQYCRHRNKGVICPKLQRPG